MESPACSPRRSARKESLLVVDSPSRHTRSAEKKRLSLPSASTQSDPCLTQLSAESEKTATEIEAQEFRSNDGVIASDQSQARSSTKRSLSQSLDPSPHQQLAGGALTQNLFGSPEGAAAGEPNLKDGVDASSDQDVPHTSSQAKRPKTNSAHKSALRDGSLTMSLPKKSVVFGSPEYVQFNKSSPAANLTPASKSVTSKNESYEKGSRMLESPESSGEAGTQLSETSESMHESAGESMSMSFDRILELRGGGSTHQPDNNESIDFGCMAPQTLDEAEQTVELEANMSDIFQQTQLFSQPPKFLETVVEQSSHSLDNSSSVDVSSAMDIDETVQFAANLGSLLHPTDDANTESLFESKVPRLSFGKSFQDSQGSMPVSIFDGKQTSASKAPGVACLGTMDVEGQSNALAVDDNLTAEVSFRVRSPMPRSAPYSVSRRQRRTPMSSRRLTLTPQKRLSLAPNGEVILKDNQVKVTSALNFEQSPPQKEVLDLRVGELIDAVNIGPDPIHLAVDLICDIHGVIISSGCASLLTRYEQFVEEICSQFTRQGPTRPNLESLIGSDEESEHHLLSLQHAIRNLSTATIIQDLQAIANAAFDFETIELEMWLLEVASHMMAMVNDFEQEASAYSQQLHDKFKFIAEEAELLSLLNAKALNKARRRSLDRRKVGLVANFHAFNFSSSYATIFFCLNVLVGSNLTRGRDCRTRG